MHHYTRRAFVILAAGFMAAATNLGARAQGGCEGPLMMPVAAQGTWRDGYKAGYTAAWKLIKGPNSLVPWIDVPFPPLGATKYEDGYQVGHIDGVAAARKGK